MKFNLRRFGWTLFTMGVVNCLLTWHWMSSEHLSKECQEIGFLLNGIVQMVGIAIVIATEKTS